ncbi:hypothetical protein L7F22_011335 [Adiantum nelumboides]|nr:hypothetical protein [Adiantum nelumboides]
MGGPVALRAQVLVYDDSFLKRAGGSRQGLVTRVQGKDVALSHYIGRFNHKKIWPCATHAARHVAAAAVAAHQRGGETKWIEPLGDLKGKEDSKQASGSVPGQGGKRLRFSCKQKGVVLDGVEEEGANESQGGNDYSSEEEEGDREGEGDARQVNNQNHTPADLDSNISTEASVNQKLNTQLETIVKDSYSDSSSKLSYFEMASSSTKVNFDLGPGHEGEYLNKTHEHQLLFLKFQFVNELGAKIYKDGMEKYCVKIEDHRGDMRDMVSVIYSGNRYFDDQGFVYIVVLNSSIVDKWGMIGTKQKVDVEPEEAPPPLSKPNLKLQRVNDMTRVNTDNIFLGLYKYDGGEHMTYYQCEERLLQELTDEKKLYVFTYGKDTKSELIMTGKYGGEHMTYYQCEERLLRELTDEKKLYVFTYGEDTKSELIMTGKYGRSYVIVEPKELAGYTYFGGPLSIYYFTPPKPEPFVRHTESMGYPVFPGPRLVLPEVRPMGSYGKTTHVESGTHSR